MPRSARGPTITQNSAAASTNRTDSSVPTVTPLSYASFPTTPIAPKAVAEARQRSVPDERTAASCPDNSSLSILISSAHPVAFLNDAAPRPPPAPARAERARDDRRGRGRPAVHAVGGLPAAGDARARGGRAAPGPRRPRR